MKTQNLVIGIAVIFLIVTVFWMIRGEKPDEVLETTTTIQTTTIEEQPKEVHYLGILPLRNPSEMLERFAGVEKYLQEETGMNIRLRLYPTSGATGGYTAVVRDITKGDISFAYLAPVTSVQAHEVSNGVVRVFTCAQKEGSPIYYGHIVVRTDSPYEKIEDLKGKPICGTSASSTSGNLMPTAMFLSKGINKTEYFKPFEFLGSHDKASEAVLTGVMEAACINEMTLDNYRDRGLRSIWRHDAVPEFNFNVNTEKVTPEELEKVKTVLLTMHETEEGLAAVKAISSKYDRWVAIEWEDYLGIKKAIDEVHGPVFYNLDEWGG